MDAAELEGGLSFFSSTHSSHDQVWSFPGESISAICIACLVETLEATDLLYIRKSKALREIVGLLSRNNKLLEELSSHISVSLHLAQVVLNLITTENHGLAELAIEGTLQLVCRLQSEQIAREVIDKLERQILDATNLRKLHSVFVLLGKLVSSIPPLVHEINTTKKELVIYFISNVNFPDENIQCALFYIFDLLAKGGTKSLDSGIAGKIFTASCEALSSAKRHEVQTNALSVIKSLCCSDKVQLIPERKKLETAPQRYDFPLAKALKKVILSSDNAIQLGSIQCISDILHKDDEHKAYSNAFLDTGIVEFLLETLDSNSDLVIGSVFKCLILFTDCATFFDSSHSIYGVEPLITALTKAVKFQNPDVIKTGLHLMVQIFVKQPRTVPVFPNKGIFCEYTAVLQEALNSMDYSVLRQAVNNLDVMLLQKHLPRNVTSDMVVTLLVPVALQLQRYHRPISTFRNANLGVAQELLASLLSVIRGALTLSRYIKQSVPSVDCILSGQDLEEVQAGLQNYLAQVTDQVCVPAVMVNYELITNSAVFEHFFAILNAQFEDNTHTATTAEFSKKLAEASFIKISMEVKHKFSSRPLNAEFSNTIDQFQRRLLFILSAEERPHERKAIGELDVISQVPSTPQDCLLMLTQSSMESYSGEVTDRSLFGLQCVSLDLLYFSHRHGDKLVQDFVLLSTLHKYIMQHKGLDLPELQSRHLIYLYAVSLQTIKRIRENVDAVQEFEESQSMICEHLRNSPVDKVELYFYHDPEFLEWVFSNDSVTQVCGASMMLQWVLYQSEEKLNSIPENYERTLRLLSSNTSCFKTLISLVTENTEIVGEVVEILDCMLSDSDSKEAVSCIVPQSYAIIVADNLHRFFLKYKGCPLEDNNCAKLLKVATVVGTRLGRFDLRIIQHTLNLLTQANCSCNVLVTAMNYLNVTIWQRLSSISEDTERVVAVLLTNKPLIQMLNKTLSTLSVSRVTFQRNTSDEEVIRSVTLLTAANLIVAAIKTNSITCEPFRVDLKAAIKLLNKRNSSLLQIATTCFWSSIFTTRFDPNLVTFLCGMNNGIEERDIQVIFLFLQNSLINDNELVRVSAVKCLASILDYTHNPAQFIYSPWNKVVLEAQSLSFDAGLPLTPSFIHLVSLFLRCDGTRDQSIVATTQAAVESITSKIPLLQPVHLNQALAWVCVEFIEAVNNNEKYSFTSSQKSSLVTWLRGLINARLEQDFERKQIKFGCFNGVLINQDLFCLVAPTKDSILTKLVSSLSSSSD